MAYQQPGPCSSYLVQGGELHAGIPGSASFRKYEGMSVRVGSVVMSAAILCDSQQLVYSDLCLWVVSLLHNFAPKCGCGTLASWAPACAVGITVCLHLIRWKVQR